MDDQNRNLILAIVLSGLVMLVWMTFFAPPEPVPPAPGTVATDASGQPIAQTPPGTAGTAPAPAVAGGEAPAPAPEAAAAPRVELDTPRLSGSISLLGARIDTLFLKDYRETLDAGSPAVELLRPVGAPEAYYSSFGWAPGGDLTFDDVPGPATLWELEQGSRLTPDTPVRLAWSNEKGQTFRLTFAVDEDYMFTVTQAIENTAGAPIRVAPYAEVVRVGEPSDLKNFFILNEGAIRQDGAEMHEFAYDDLRELETDATWGATTEVVRAEQNGWLGFTDHYWQAMVIPQADRAFSAVLRYEAGTDSYKSIARYDTTEVAAGATAGIDTRLFAGAKEWATIRDYERQGGVYRFIDSIDWGWFFFLTKPMFWLLHTLHGLIGNMGWAIIALTFVIKALVFPLAYKSYVSMAKMKELQPEMEKLKERAGDDRMKMQKEMMDLYRKEKVNPASGCLPILIQIPIFFSLYKVIFVTLELRHAAWFGWIRDLSVPDPSSIYNLFGLLPWPAPEPTSILALIFIGILPIVLGISMWLQQKLNPTPTDPTQAAIFAWMPWIFMFMLGGFASGLVVYWIANNMITFAQQYIIMTSHGHKPDIFGNIRAGFNRRRGTPAAANGPKKPAPSKK